MSYQSPRDRIRWFAAVNRGTRTIPGFGLCSTKLTDVSDYEVQENLEGQVCWRVYPCPETECYELQDPTQLWVNGPTPIAPGAFGKISQDWPLQVLHNGNADGLPSGYECGPAAPSQTAADLLGCVWSGGNAFVCHSHDATLASDRKGIHTVWISPNTRRALPIYGLASFAGTYAKEAAALTWLDATNLAPGPKGVTSYGGGFKVAFDALVWLSFSGTLTSADAAEGSPLGMRVTVDDEETELYGYRSMTIDTDYPSTTFRTAENVACSGPLFVRRGQVVKLVVGTSTGYQTTVAAGRLALHRIYTPYDRTISALLRHTGP